MAKNLGGAPKKRVPAWVLNFMRKLRDSEPKPSIREAARRAIEKFGLEPQAFERVRKEYGVRERAGDLPTDDDLFVAAYESERRRHEAEKARHDDDSVLEEVADLADLSTENLELVLTAIERDPAWDILASSGSEDVRVALFVERFGWLPTDEAREKMSRLREEHTSLTKKKELIKRLVDKRKRER